MKRDHIIERLMAIGYADKCTLSRMSNVSLDAVYESTREIRERHRELVLRADRRARRKLEEQHRRQVNWERSCAWSNRWVHPKVQYPLRTPTDLELAAIIIQRTGG